MSAAVFARGFFSSPSVHVALAVGGVAAAAAGAVGVFTVLRGQAFAGEALGDVGATGGSGAFLVGAGPLTGFVVIDLVAAAAMELVGVQRPRGRDMAAGIVLGAGLGLAALLLYLDSTYRGSTGAVVTVLFGSVFATSSSTIPVAAALALAVGAILAAVNRPLLLSSVSPELAAAKGVPVRLVGGAHLLALALSVSLCALAIGTILGTALLVGPAAAALALVRRPAVATLVAAAIGVGCTWAGILLAYDSYYWPPSGHGWPVSFFVVALVFAVYVSCSVAARRRSA